jgi:hypothetical protein
MRVTSLFRYPVKSMQGETLDAAEVGPSGLVGDRRFGLLDVTAGSVLTGRRVPELLMAAGRFAADGSGAAEIELPDGRISAGDDDLSAWLGRPIRLLEAGADGMGTFEASADPEDEAGEWVACPLPSEAFHDVDHRRVTIIAEAELRDWPVRRFRPNIVVSGDTVADLVGKRLRLGEVELHVPAPVDRCAMVNRAQPGGIERDISVLRTVKRELGMLLGVGATVSRPGTVRVGEELTVLA